MAFRYRRSASTPTRLRPPSPTSCSMADSSMHQALFACQQARRFDTALDMLEERVQQDLRQHDARRKSLIRRSTGLGDQEQARAIRDTLDSIRRDLEENLARIEAQLADRLKQRLLPASIAPNKIDNLLEDLSDHDITQEESDRLIHLSVATAFIKKACRLVQDLVHDALQGDLEMLRAELPDLSRQIAARTENIKGLATAELLRPPDESATWEALKSTIHIDPRYHGELPRKRGLDGLFEWVMHGRRPVFLIMMIAGMGGSLVSGLRELLAPLMLFAFIGGLIWARHSFKAESAERIERELIRLREMLGSEIRRLHEQALRDWATRATQHLRDLAKRIAQCHRRVPHGPRRPKPPADPCTSAPRSRLS